MASTWVRKAADWAKRRGIVALSAVFLLVPIILMYRAYSTTDVEAPRTWRPDRMKPAQVPASAPSVVEAVTNATLGFEKLLVLSVRPSWRTRGLEAAAKLTGLDFTVLPQTPSPDDVLHAFQQKAHGKGVGSAKAWLAHLDVLKHVISSGLETALIVEDDLDWDVSLRTKQMALVVDHVRNFTGVGPDDLSTTSPYGDAWDVLWLGHCGAEMRPVPAAASVAAAGWSSVSQPYFDPLRLNGTGARPHWGLDTLRWKGTGWQHPPAGIRLVQDGGAVCSWAYAVSRRSADKVLARMVQGDNQAFDIGLKDACDRSELNCVTVVPGVMSSYSPPADLGYQSPVRVGDGKGVKGNESDFEGVRGTTPDVVYSARCEALFAEQCIP
ncbi:hypothetical protein PG997_001469 [Apiospora hydei]|uniref:Glycosyltransferase family 25 protein n=1 Tax=Apiospora hydei TaxID=1337664 RepID=A0ABR1XDS1_9PEZI